MDRRGQFDVENILEKHYCFCIHPFIIVQIHWQSGQLLQPRVRRAVCVCVGVLVCVVCVCVCRVCVCWCVSCGVCVLVYGRAQVSVLRTAI